MKSEDKWAFIFLKHFMDDVAEIDEQPKDVARKQSVLVSIFTKILNYFSQN